MQTNDYLLMKIIEKDMDSKNVLNYQLSDEVVRSAKLLQVKANEAIYVFYFKSTSDENVNVDLASATDVIRYRNYNTLDKESNLISRHWSSISIETEHSFVLRLVRVIFTLKDKK